MHAPFFVCFEAMALHKSCLSTVPLGGSIGCRRDGAPGLAAPSRPGGPGVRKAGLHAEAVDAATGQEHAMLSHTVQ